MHEETLAGELHQRQCGSRDISTTKSPLTLPETEADGPSIRSPVPPEDSNDPPVPPS